MSVVTMLKGFAIAVGVLALGFLALRAYYVLVANPAVAEQLQEDPDGVRAGIVMLLTLPDGRVLPVNYLRDGDRVYAGADGRWWRALRDGDVPVKLLIRGKRHSGRAHVVLDDAEFKRDVFQRLRPDVPKWLPGWLDAELVVIDLDAEAATR